MAQISRQRVRPRGTATAEKGTQGQCKSTVLYRLRHDQNVDDSSNNGLKRSSLTLCSPSEIDAKHDERYDTRSFLTVRDLEEVTLTKGGVVTPFYGFGQGGGHTAERDDGRFPRVSGCVGCCTKAERKLNGDERSVLPHL